MIVVHVINSKLYDRNALIELTTSFVLHWAKGNSLTSSTMGTTGTLE